jgi:predicted ATPase/DNA-binding NarL/FixJ family response regulator
LAIQESLPVRLNSFVGRDHDLAEVRRLLSEARLVTLTGAPGVGKTRLALEIADGLLDVFSDGIWFVDLAALADPTLVPWSLAATLGVREDPGRPLYATLVDWLRARHTLLILDNCEHLLAACATLVEGLLRACPGLAVLATSREPLGIAGETAWRVTSLTLPGEDQPAAPDALPSSLLHSEAVRLFVERALAAWPDFALTAANAAPVVRVCRRLDGIPLALELAAVRVRALTVEQIADHLDDRFRLLIGGSRVALPRQQTLRAAVDWSYELLPVPERVLLRRLTVFAGGWQLEAAEAVCSGQEIDASDVLDLLQHLVDKSLVVADARPDGTLRYRMLETLHQYALERLLESGEEDEAHRRHAVHALALAEQADPELRGPHEREWSERLEDDIENLRAALRWTIERAEAELTLRLGSALWLFWSVRGHLIEGLHWLEQALPLGGDAGDGTPELLRARAGALNGAGNLAMARGEPARSATFHEESLVLRRRLGDTTGEAVSLNNLGIAARGLGNRALARDCFEQSLSRFRSLGDIFNAALSLLNLSRISHDEGDQELATTLVTESLALFREAGNAQGVGTSLNKLGELARDRGELSAATRFHDEALSVHRRRSDPWGIGISLTHLARVAAARPDPVATMALAAQALQALHEAGAGRDAVAALVLMAGVLCARGDAALGGRLLGAVTRAHPEGLSIPVERASFEQTVAAARAALSAEAFAAAWESGQQLTLDEAINLALATIESPAHESSEPASPPPGPTVDALSRREREVAALVADGLTNREIAEALTISETTVHSHISHILRNLGFRSRAQVAAWATERGLLP